MTLPASGSLTLAQVAAELSVAGAFDMNRVDARYMANVAAAPAPYQMNSFYSKACVTKDVTITANNPIGYVQGNWGVISPDDSFKGQQITQLYQNNPGVQFTLALFGTSQAQNFFKGIMLRAGAGTGGLPTIFLDTSVASYTASSGSTFWTWTAALPNWSGLVGQAVRIQLVN